MFYFYVISQIFSSGVPEPYLIQLGNIARMYSEEEMSFWNITSLDTLATLIQSASWNSSDPKVCFCLPAVFSKVCDIPDLTICIAALYKLKLHSTNYLPEFDFSLLQSLYYITA